MWTKIYIFSIFAYLCMTVKYNAIYAKRILIVSALPSYSHQISYRGLLLELNRRGHEIVSVTTDPMKNTSLTNYTEIDLHYFYRGFPEYRKFGTYSSFTDINVKLPVLSAERLMWHLNHVINNEVLKNSEVKKLYAADSNEHFDAVIMPQGYCPSLNAFAYRFNAPLIGISSLDTYNQMRYVLGSVVLPSHFSNWQTNWQIESNMPLWKRLINFYEVWMQVYYWVNVFLYMEDSLAKEYLGPDIPSSIDITKNMSIYLVNRHPVLSYARPENPNVIFYHGSHIATTPPALPQDLKQFLDDAREGFIYVSLGSNLAWEYLPENTFVEFIEAFSTLPYKIVWKCDPDKFPGKFKNMLVSKWLPQQSILAHPNIRLFVYQGGIQSTEEAVYYSVPLIGLPIGWDQRHQVQNIVRLGIGVYLHYKAVSKESIQAAIHKIMSNERYKDRMNQLSKLYKDVPYDTVQNAVWWIEYVMRHNGTSSFRNGLCDEPWYQRYDWDIIGFFAITAFTAFLILLRALFQILCFIHGRRIFCHGFQRYYTKLKKQ